MKIVLTSWASWTGLGAPQGSWDHTWRTEIIGHHLVMTPLKRRYGYKIIIARAGKRLGSVSHHGLASACGSMSLLPWWLPMHGVIDRGVQVPRCWWGLGPRAQEIGSPSPSAAGYKHTTTYFVSLFSQLGNLTGPGLRNALFNKI